MLYCNNISSLDLLFNLICLCTLLSAKKLALPKNTLKQLFSILYAKCTLYATVLGLVLLSKLVDPYPPTFYLDTTKTKALPFD